MGLCIMCQRLNTGESYNFYFGIFICCGPLKSLRMLKFQPALIIIIIIRSIENNRARVSLKLIRHYEQCDLFEKCDFCHEFGRPYEIRTNPSSWQKCCTGSQQPMQ